MSMNDPIADLLTRVRNAIQVRHDDVFMPYSRLKEDICKVLQREGYVEGYSVAGEGAKKSIRIQLRYAEDGKPVIHGLRRVSKPSLRNYVESTRIKPVRSGLGISIFTTSHGVITGKEARDRNVGGEILCEVW